MCLKRIFIKSHHSLDTLCLAFLFHRFLHGNNQHVRFLPKSLNNQTKTSNIRRKLFCTLKKKCVVSGLFVGMKKRCLRRITNTIKSLVSRFFFLSPTQAASSMLFSTPHDENERTVYRTQLFFRSRHRKS